jgi:hypothetical protein
LDAQFLRETGAIDDYFSIIKTQTAEPLRFARFRVSEGSLHATFKSVAGRTYRIQRTTRLEDPEWADISEDIPAIGATTHWSGPVPGDSQHYFFRVVRTN